MSAIIVCSESKKFEIGMEMTERLNKMIAAFYATIGRQQRQPLTSNYRWKNLEMRTQIQTPHRSTPNERDIRFQSSYPHTNKQWRILFCWRELALIRLWYRMHIIILIIIPTNKSHQIVLASVFFFFAVLCGRKDCFIFIYVICAYFIMIFIVLFAQLLTRLLISKGFFLVDFGTGRDHIKYIKI